MKIDCPAGKLHKCGTCLRLTRCFHPWYRCQEEEEEEEVVRGEKGKPEPSRKSNAWLSLHTVTPWTLVFIPHFSFYSLLLCHSSPLCLFHFSSACQSKDPPPPILSAHVISIPALISPYFLLVFHLKGFLVKSHWSVCDTAHMSSLLSSPLLLPSCLSFSWCHRPPPEPSDRKTNGRLLVISRKGRTLLSSLTATSNRNTHTHTMIGKVLQIQTVWYKRKVGRLFFLCEDAVSLVHY